MVVVRELALDMEIETSRLRIRSFRTQDHDDYYEIVADPDVMKHLGGVLSSGRAMKYIEHAMQTESEYGFARYAVELKESGDLIGMCGFAPVRDYIDLGYRFAKNKWGYGFATEATSAVVNSGFTKNGFDQIVGLAHPDNGASIRVLQKLGFSYVQDEVTPMGMKAKRYVAKNSTR